MNFCTSKNFKILTILVFGVAVGRTAFSCGTALGTPKPGNKVVGIPMSSGYSFNEDKSEMAMDDDGMLVMSLALAACMEDAPEQKVVLTDVQERCALNAQYDAKLENLDTIYFRVYHPSYVAARVANNLIIEKCGFDALALWKKKLEEMAEEPVPCAEKARPIIKKAAARVEEYVKEQTTPAYLAKLNLPEAQKQAYVAVMEKSKEKARNWAATFSQSPIPAGVFHWQIYQLEEELDNHAYQIVKDPSEPYDPKKTRPLRTILSGLKSKLPGATSYSKCGPGFPQDMLDILQSVIWEPRSSTLNPLAPVNGGAKQ